MTKEQFENEKKYIGTMMIAKNLLKQGIIGKEEYCEIDTKYRDIYSVSLSTIFTDINLINQPDYGKM